jgi:Tfp pilus assembly protein PilN
VVGFNFIDRREGAAGRFVRVPAHMRMPLLAFAAAVAIACGAWGIESQRLHQALASEAGYESSARRAELRVEALRLSAAQVGRRLSLDRRVRSIRESGTGQARRIAELGNALPQDVWLTAVREDDTGIALEGGASNLAALGRAVRILASDRGASRVTLLRASAAEDGEGPPISFALHVATGAGGRP